MTKDEVVQSLKNLSIQQKQKKYLTLQDVRKIPRLDYYIQLHFKRLGIALQVAGLPSSKLASSMKISSEDLLKYLNELRIEVGHNPKVWDIYRDKTVYKKYSESKFSWSILKTRFGGLTKAIELMEKKYELEGKSDKVQNSNNKAVKNSDYFQDKSKFWGEAAELHVTAELLYRGFQAANIPVDVGLDVLAVKDNKTFYFQVKHKDLGGNHPIKLTKSSFDRSGGGNVYYIFVLLSEKKREFLIIPFHIVNDWIREGHAIANDKEYLIYINQKDGKYKVKDIVLNNYIDRWEDIR